MQYVQVSEKPLRPTPFTYTTVDGDLSALSSTAQYPVLRTLGHGAFESSSLVGHGVVDCPNKDEERVI